ncbi:hypothetical protein [Bombilactobacillus bombi]|uniref:hypothetical protein n=1 Tax=Bombilactobacillus bombi TaxID=1303590 RepID=UPI0015E5CE27|nr:hypothetical protein [Bombilactobacillus bombi]MBA1435247.1 hypothetical protein [Bombilactobacillus bombi]
MKRFFELMFLMSIVTSVSSLAIFNTEAQASVVAIPHISIEPRRDIIVWRYKTIHGVLYERKYNKSTGQWIGSWRAV